ncbi:MAG: NmrA family NAD(P)-binding protein [Anaerolineales bacterium]|nr:MAG: NmrA family NAD(P)-binding protein [Anaerolineales bacterium]
MILVTGAGGKTGKAIIKTLSGVESVCAFVRREENVSILQSLGVENVVVGDLLDKSALRSALKGIRAIYHICPNMSPDEETIGRLIIDEAKKAGVEHFVYHSVLHPQIEAMNHHWQKMRVEEALFESGIPFTILQPAPYMQNLLVGWKSIVEEGVLRMPYSVEAKFSFVDLDDVAEAAKIVLTESTYVGAVYELAGTSPVSHAEVTKQFEGRLNRPVRAEKIEIQEWRSRAGNLSEYARENLIRIFEYYDKWGLAGNSNVLTWLLKREPSSFENFIARAVKENNAKH